MKKIISLILLTLFLSCKKANHFKVNVSHIPVQYKVKRFENDFFSHRDLSSLRKEYPQLLPLNTPDSTFIIDRKDTILNTLSAEVKKKYGDISTLKQELKKLIQHVKYYYPDFQVKKVITLVNNPSQNYHPLYADSLILIPLESYLGAGSQYYKTIEPYLRKNKNRAHLLSDVAESIADYLVPQNPSEGRYLNLLVYQGKKMLLKDAFLPDTPDSIKIGYTPHQMEWVKKNEFRLWNYYLQREMLFKTEPDYAKRFIDEAPFSKFYTDNDLDIPPRVGIWQGWQIMRQYMEKNPKVTLQNAIQDMEPERIYSKSKYKPRK